MRRITFSDRPLADNSGLHDAFCRCRSCKPPLPTPDNSDPVSGRVMLGLIVGCAITLVVMLAALG